MKRNGKEKDMKRPKKERREEQFEGETSGRRRASEKLLGPHLLFTPALGCMF